MSKQLEAAFSKLAEGLEQAAAAATEIAGVYGNASAKSGSDAADAVASKPATRGKTAAPAEAVAGKSAKAGKAKPPAITFEVLKAKLTELVNLKGKEVLKEMLSEVGAAKLADVDEDNYADLHAKAVEALNVEEEPPATEDDDLFGE